VSGEDTTSDEAIAKFCLNTDARNVIFLDELGGITVIKISDTAVVKIGATEQESKNQRIARTLVDPRLVHIPFTIRNLRPDKI
jgi:hypothetical protein